MEYYHCGQLQHDIVAIKFVVSSVYQEGGGHESVWSKFRKKYENNYSEVVS